MYINAIMTGFSASYLLRYDLSFFIVMVRFGLYTTVPKVCFCVQFHVMAVLFTFFNIELYKYLDICFIYIHYTCTYQEIVLVGERPQSRKP